MHRERLISVVLAGIALVILFAADARAQQLDVTFRYYPTEDGLDHVYVPGSFNSWGGPYISGTNCIMPGNVSEMTLNADDGSYRKTVALNAGTTYTYKIQIQRNPSGTDCTWLSDPLNPETTGPNNDSVLDVSDPLLFQPTEEIGGNNRIEAFSAGLFSSQTITDIRYTLNNVEFFDGLDHYDASSGVFRVEPPGELPAGARFKLVLTDAGGRTDSLEIGELFSPIEWATEAFTTVQDDYELSATVTNLDGAIDPGITQATLLRGGVEEAVVDVNDGLVAATVPIERGENTFELRAEIDGTTVLSDPLVITGRLSPLEHVFFTSEVSGAGYGFTVSLTATDVPLSDVSYEWTLDESASTTTVQGLTAVGLKATGTTDGPGEIYFDVVATTDDDEDYARIGVVVEEDGSARTLAYAETASWIDEAVVYEIFALQFGPTASGSASNPGNRFREITEELDYIADMGFNTIWFMPVMQSRNQTPIGAGYDIIDFFNVDHKLGTNEDFRALVDRAHELGIKVVIDWTPNHTAPNHPWAQSLFEGGAYSDWYQREFNPHTSGHDGRGANLPEGIRPFGASQYVGYDGFGDLANLNWENPDLRATMLDVVEHWAREFDIDGWRLDVYWGPWRRYGPDVFGTPLRQAFRRVRPDGWLLGEITGVGSGTEVYYADDENGNPLVGGLDAAYDWNMYFGAIRVDNQFNYNVDNYHNAAFASGFWPGPNARYFRFLENHDEPRVASLTPNEDRILVATGFLLTTSGVPMIYAGQEVGYGAGSGDTRRTPVNWETPDNGKMAETHQWLAHARTQFPAFTTQAMTRIETGVDAVYGVVRPWSDENAVVLINFSSIAQTVSVDPSDVIDWSTDGPVPYHDIRQDTSRAYLDGFEVTVPAYTTVVYITGDDVEFTVPDLPALPFGAVYTSDERTAELPAETTIDGIWPNPVRTEAAIEFTMPEAGRVTLSAFDLLGRRVAVIEDGVAAAGRHRAFWTPGDIPSGVYMIRLDAPGMSVTRTVVRVR